MTAAVIEVGPATIRGPNHPELEQATAALECIDDNLGWVGDHPVAASELWRDVLRETVGGPVDSLVLVCPTWWPSSWTDVVHDAALTVATTVVAMSRVAVLRYRASERPLTVVEIAGELVVVAQCGEELGAVPRCGEVDVDADAIAERIARVGAVLVDIPEGVEGGRLLADAIANRLRANGVAVTITDHDDVRRAVAALHERAASEEPEAVAPQRRSRHGIAVLAGALLSAVALCGGFAVNSETPGLAGDAMPMTLLVEGRVGVKVPAQWMVQRITSGLGSARVQVVSPSDAGVIVHITQSTLAPEQTMEMVAESLGSALSEEPVGVFVDFNPAARHAEKPAVTYREIRKDRQIGWTVLVDKALRIAIGCQSAPGREELVRDICDRAIESAHAVF
ncbi:type VII secretion-associated protein [Mycobacterium sp.]|uniref:type VII secretion-associated protein n=1 Tax=Mycobacterium sp. TaxID=1785 RepID=UPI002C89CD84|nr:type VII secretion-associated protein [Mycobacterium sp.]HKP44605.1 type VII secretion-associated protein [Mycobacterium sp.]